MVLNPAEARRRAAEGRPFDLIIRMRRIKFQREVENPRNCSQQERSREGDEILVTYKGFLEDGQVFDNNEGKDPIRFVLGEKKVIAGWERGLTGTCAGEKVVMVIPPELGYGDGGAGGGVIPGGATLYFITTLQGIVRVTEPTSPGSESLDSDGNCKDIKTVKEKDKLELSSTVSVDGNVVDKSDDSVEVGRGSLVRGWELGLIGSCEGETRQLYLGPDVAWKDQGVPGIIPSNAPVSISVTVRSVKRDLVFNFLDQISSGTFRRG